MLDKLIDRIADRVADKISERQKVTQADRERMARNHAERARLEHDLRVQTEQIERLSRDAARSMAHASIRIDPRGVARVVHHGHQPDALDVAAAQELINGGLFDAER